MTARIGPSLALFATLPFVHAQTGNVLVVSSPGSGAPFTSVQSAVDAALNGDLVLVQQMLVPQTAVVDGKSVALVADDTAPSWVVPAGASTALSIRNIPAAKSFVARGFIFGAPGDDYAGQFVDVRDCAGLVWLDTLRCGAGRPSLVLNNAAAVVITDLIVDTPQKSPSGSVGGDALELTASAVHIHSSTVFGEAGHDAAVGQTSNDPATPGGVAIRMQASQLLLANTFVYGGRGGASAYGPDVFGTPQCVPGADGGDGIVVQNAASSGYAIGGVIVGGYAPGSAQCPGGVNGEALVNPAGAAIAGVLTAQRGIENFTLAAREGESFSIKLFGPKNELVVLGASVQPQSLLLWPLGGLEIGIPQLTQPLGVMPTLGTMNQFFTISELGAGVSWVPLFLQAAHVAPTGSVLLGEPTMIALLDAAY
jgi:hypothetical protein